MRPHPPLVVRDVFGCWEIGQIQRICAQIHVANKISADQGHEKHQLDVLHLVKQFATSSDPIHP